MYETSKVKSLSNLNGEEEEYLQWPIIIDLMEDNDLSFSIPSWKKIENRQMAEFERDLLSTVTPYYLNDFKNTNEDLPRILSPPQTSTS